MLDSAMVTWGAQLYGDSQSPTQVHSGIYQSKGHSLPVAIKTLRLTEEQLGSTIQELLIQSMLEDCRFICRLYGYFLNKGQICIVSEALGVNLEEELTQRIASKREYSESELIARLADLIEALLFAQRKSLAHRDIKPQNILLTLTPPFQVKLVDFGSGCLVDGQIQRLTGTPLYMSPELIPALQLFQATGELPVSTSDPYLADVYSLGVTFLHLALAEVPIRLMLREREVALGEYLARLRLSFPGLVCCLEQMLRTNPAARPTFEDLQTTLKPLRKASEESLPGLATLDHFTGTAMESSTQEQKQAYLQYWTTEYSLSQPHSLDNLNYIFSSALFSRFSVLLAVRCGACTAPMQLSEESRECAVHGLICALCSQTHDAAEVRCRVCGRVLPFCWAPGKLFVCSCDAPAILSKVERTGLS